MKKIILAGITIIVLIKSYEIINDIINCSTLILKTLPFG